MEDKVKEVAAPTNVHHIQDMVQKLDSILALVFDHYHETHATALKDEPPDELSSSYSMSDLPPLPPILPSTPSTPALASSFYSPSLELPIFFSSPSPGSSSPIRSFSPPLTSTQIYKPSHEYILRSQFHTLLSIFDRTILRTFKSRYTQFLIFWFTSLNSDFSDTFQGMLVDTALFQPDTPIVTRSAAASYIASFVSRAKFVDQGGCRKVVGLFCDFLASHVAATEEYLKSSSKLEREAMLSNVDKHSVFYSVCQAVFLIFCFRWRDLLEDLLEEENTGYHSSPNAKARNKWIKPLSVVVQVVTSPLNPLKVTSF